MGSRFAGLVFDCEDPRKLGAWWAEVLGFTVTEADEEDVSVEDPSGQGPEIYFQRVPEPKTAKLRMHLDVRPTGTDQAAELERLLSLGAVKVDVGQGTEVSWVVLADPEGNEFCLLQTPAD